MKIATGSILNMTPAGHDWTVVFHHGDTEQIVAPVIGWATVIDAHLTDGTAVTSIQPAFLYLDTIWTPAELREHDHEVSAITINAREIARA